MCVFSSPACFVFPKSCVLMNKITVSKFAGVHVLAVLFLGQLVLRCADIFICYLRIINTMLLLNSQSMVLPGG